METASEPQNEDEAELPAVTEAVLLELANLARPESKASAPAKPASPEDEARLRTGVDRTISLIRNGGSKLEQLLEKVRSQDDSIRQLKEELAQSKSQLNLESQKVTKRVHEESERAEKAEANVRALELQIKQFEAREKMASVNLERVMKIVDETFAKAERVNALEAATRQLA